MPRGPYSYRDDLSVPPFPDDRPIIVFDGVCVLCSGWARFVMRHDPEGRYRLLTVQSPLGQALYRHYGLDTRDYETNLLLADGQAWIKSESSIRMCEGLGAPWSWVRVLRLLPLAARDRLYDLVARNRYRWFGQRETCFLPGPEVRARFLA
jgi:predicted DCC family thiol-disulfide oxidoreductase YuxK